MSFLTTLLDPLVDLFSIKRNMEAEKAKRSYDELSISHMKANQYYIKYKDTLDVTPQILEQLSDKSFEDLKNLMTIEDRKRKLKKL
jgi:hypothetical protein